MLLSDKGDSGHGTGKTHLYFSKRFGDFKKAFGVNWEVWMHEGLPVSVTFVSHGRPSVCTDDLHRWSYGHIIPFLNSPQIATRMPFLWFLMIRCSPVRPQCTLSSLATVAPFHQAFEGSW